jgi:hypothetical protein
VRGLGCGHRLAPVLAQLDKVQGVKRSYANHTGDMVRVSVHTTAHPDNVAGQVLKLLNDDQRNPERVMGAQFKQALDTEQWREKERIDELSAIEFRMLGLRRMRTFAEKEQLDNETTERLLKIVDEEWDRMAKGRSGNGEKGSGQTDWAAFCGRCAAVVVERARSVLSAEQVERLKQSLDR